MGGLYFEYARYDVLVNYWKASGFLLLRGNPSNGIRCDELVLCNAAEFEKSFTE